MQISRPLLLTCLLASAVLPAITQAADTEAQRKAREALQQKLKEMESQTPAAPQAAPAPAPATKPQPAPAPKATKPAKPEFQPVPSSTPAVPPPAATQPVPTRELKVAPAQPAQPAPAPAAQAAPQSDVGYFEPVPETDNAEAEKARQALREQLRKAGPQPEPTIATSSQPKASARSKYQDSLPPLQGPPTGLSPEKEEKLRVLLEDYRADRLTPDQYHAERARILAAP